MMLFVVVSASWRDTRFRRKESRSMGSSATAGGRFGCPGTSRAGGRPYNPGLTARVRVKCFFGIPAGDGIICPRSHKFWAQAMTEGFRQQCLLLAWAHIESAACEEGAASSLLWERNETGFLLRDLT